MSNEQNEQLFTREQVIKEMSRKLSLDKSGESYTELPNENLDELENSSTIHLQKNIKEFTKNLPKELRRRTMDALQGTSAIYKGADRLITTGRAATGIYEECQHFLETGGNEEQFLHIMEGVRQLAVYSYATSRATETEARSMAIKALRLPYSVKHLEEEPPSDKSLALDKQDVDKLFHARYEQSMLRNAIGRRHNTSNQRGKIFGKQQWNTRGREGFQKSFFGRGRGPKQAESQTPNQPQ
ncbi:hypothetical protein G6F43_008582 [Rhizopus delemar]|nr:hypothetical protein G6F43_008582 [Rhizopus delemar]